VRIGLLGPLAVHDEAGRPVRVGGALVRVLLILLALDAGRVVPAYSLIERLWDGEPPANAANSLQSLVSRLRTSLRQAGLDGQVIESHPAGYRLAVSPDQVDAVAFERLARDGSAALAAGDPAAAAGLLREALGAWRGPALADAAGARFAAGPAARLEELRTRAALDLIEAGLALGESDGLVGELRDMIAADPVAERPRGLLMRALYAAGRQAEALAVYTDLRERLASDLGVDPSPQIEQIHLGVLRQDLAGPAGNGQVKIAPAAQPPPGGLEPPRLTGVRKPLTSFVGRDTDVARVVKMLAEGRLVTLTGPGGAGKTRLATETATRLAGQSHGPGGGRMWLVELSPVADPAEVPSAVLHALGIREVPVITMAAAGQPALPTDPVKRLVAVLAGRKDLLILDNCEHVVAAAAALADRVLAGCPGVRILATSREPLRIDGEALWPVAPLPVPSASPDGAAGDVVAGYASVRLLADRAAAVRPGFTVDETNAADVARICWALDGMPLAIELAAARLRTLSAAQLAQRLDARFDLLTGGSRTAAARHQTLRAVVDWSWELLSGPEQVLARRLAVFPGGATLTAAEQVCQDAALPASSVLPALFGLVEKSFLTVDSGGEPRYRMLETIRAYCLERLAEAGEEDAVRRAFAAAFVRLAETADPLLRTVEQGVWMRRLTEEQDNLHTALRWAIEHRDPVLALRFAASLGWFWLLRGQRRESADMSMDVLAMSGPADLAGLDTGGLDVVQARAICAVITAISNWDIASVRGPLADAEPLVMPEGDGLPDPLPHPLVVVGSAMLGLYIKQDPDWSLRVLARYSGSGDRWLRAGTRLIHAFFSMGTGHADQVTGQYAEAYAGFQALGDRWGMALALMGEAELAMLHGDFTKAIASLERAIEVSRALTDWEDAAQMYASLAKARSRTGDFDGALAAMERAERMFCSLGGSENELWIPYVQAELAWLRGDFATVSRVSQRLDGLLAGKPAEMGWSFRALVLARCGLAKQRTGSPEETRDALAGALRLAAEGQDRASVAAVLDALAAAAVWQSEEPGNAGWAATLLGAAHSVRGIFDAGSLDAPQARDTARRVLGREAFEAAYQHGRELSYAEALALAGDYVRRR
jgi:predicted ATPase/DNA-binding SARP family transcriptional activator